MDTLQFRCQKCGHCCRNLNADIDDGKGSLFLLPEERKLFPPDLIRPLYAVGRKGRSRPRPTKIISYQINTYICPHIKPDNSCAIYAQRPMMCRSFPLEGKGIVVLTRSCKFIEKTLPEGEIVKNLIAPREEDANHILSTWIFQMLEKPLWYFDLNTQKFHLFQGDKIRRQLGLE